jgi:5-methylcytosine-specific restriction protein A
MSPFRAPRPCAQNGCSALTSSGRCPEHQKAAQQAYRAVRGTVAERGYDARWAAYSRQYRREHPLCVLCERQGRTVASEHTDHIERVTGPDDPRFYDPTNHRAVCKSHHSSKTVLEDGGFGNARKPKGDVTC